MSARSIGGFTLLEVVVAIAILGLAIGATFQVFTTGFGQSRVAADNALAVIHAEARLAELDATGAIAPGETEGRIDDRFSWRVTINPIDLGAPSDPSSEPPPVSSPESSPASSPEPGGRVRAYAVDVVVSWGETDPPRSVRLSTVRLGPAPEE